MSRLSLSDELALLGRKPDGGQYMSASAALAVAGGELAELALAGRVGLDWKRAWLIDATPTQHPTLDGLLAQLASRPKPMSITRCLQQQSRNYSWRLNCLASAGWLRHEQRKALGIFPVQRYVPHPDAHRAVFDRLHAVVRGWSQPDPSTTSMAGIVYGSMLGRALFPHRDDRAALKKFGEVEPIGRTIQRMLAANGAAASAAAGAGAAAGGGC